MSHDRTQSEIEEMETGYCVSTGQVVELNGVCRIKLIPIREHKENLNPTVTHAKDGNGYSIYSFDSGSRRYVVCVSGLLAIEETFKMLGEAIEAGQSAADADRNGSDAN
jgi:hypothetical protein